MKLSARNQLKGTVIAIHPGAVNAIVIMELEGGQLITSSISMGSLKDLELEVGKRGLCHNQGVVGHHRRGRLAAENQPEGRLEKAPLRLHLQHGPAGRACGTDLRKTPLRTNPPTVSGPLSERPNGSAAQNFPNR